MVEVEPLSSAGAVPQASESEVQQPVTSHQKGVRLVLEAQQSEAQEERRRLDVWTKVSANLTSSLPQEAPAGSCVCAGRKIVWAGRVARRAELHI